MTSLFFCLWELLDAFMAYISVLLNNNFLIFNIFE